jgi:hypothetical protein
LACRSASGSHADLQAQIREVAQDYIETAVAAGQTREDATAKVRKIITDGIAEWRRSNFKIVDGRA